MFLFWLWIKEATTSLFRNAWWNSMALFLAMSCLMFYSVAYSAGKNIENFAVTLDKKLEITLNLVDDVNQYDEVEKQLKAMEKVKDVRFVSKEKAYEKMEKTLEGNAEMLHVLQKNPFPASFIVKLNDPKETELFAQEVQKMDIVESVKYGKGYADRLLKFTEVIRDTAYIGTALSAFFTVFVVISAIRINIVQRKDEIRIKQLIGADMFTVRIPFIIEAIILTMTASIIVYFLFGVGYENVIENIRQTIPYSTMISKELILKELIKPLFIISFLIALVGSLVSTQRFLQKY